MNIEQEIKPKVVNEITITKEQRESTFYAPLKPRRKNNRKKTRGRFDQTIVIADFSVFPPTFKTKVIHH